MRVLVLSPSIFPSLTGNAVTTERWRRSMEREGHQVEVISSRAHDPARIRRDIGDLSPHIIHGYHLFQSAAILAPLMDKGQLRGLPIVLSPSGTDLNRDWHDAGKRAMMVKILSASRAIVTQSASIGEKLRLLFPAAKNRIVFVPKSLLWLGDTPCDLRKATGCGAGDVIFFMPAGVRPVKRNLESLGVFKRVHALRENARVVFSGPVIDREYGERFIAECAGSAAFARYIPEIPPEMMRSAYRDIDVVFNNSLSEGLSNALLEAAASGRPILASDIPGNRAPVLGENEEEQCGLLFRVGGDDGDCLRKAVKLIDDRGLRDALGERGAARARSWPTPGDECARLLAVYKSVTGGAGELSRQECSSYGDGKNGSLQQVL